MNPKKDGTTHGGPSNTEIKRMRRAQTLRWRESIRAKSR